MKKMTIDKFLCAAAAALTLAAVSCNKSESYAPGPETPDGCIAAYFTSSNESSIILSPEQYAAANVITLNVAREVSDSQVSVPIEVLYKSGEIEIPAAVEFQAGESSATVEIRLNGLQEKVEYPFSIKLADEYADHYTMLEGSDVFTGSVLIARWAKVVEDATFYFNGEYFPTTYSDIYHLDGFNRFYIENFLGSGIDLGFSIKSYDSSKKAFIPFSATDKTTWAGKFVPLDHFLDDPNGNPWWWLMSDVVNYAYACWKPDGFKYYINYINFYAVDNDITYDWIDMNGSADPEEPTGYLCSYTYLSPYESPTDDFDDYIYPNYINLYMYWNGMEK